MKKVFKDVIEVAIKLDTEALKRDCETVYKTLKEDYGGATCSEFTSKAIEYIMDYCLERYTFYNIGMSLEDKEEAFENLYRGIEEYVTWYWKTVIVKDFEWSD